MDRLRIDTSTENQYVTPNDEIESNEQLHQWVNTIYPEFYHWMVNKDLVTKLAKKKIEASSPVKRISLKHEQNISQDINILEEKYSHITAWLRYHLIHLTRLLSYFKRMKRHHQSTPLSNKSHQVLCHSPQRKFRVDVNIPTVSRDFEQKEQTTLNQFQTLLFISNKLGLKNLYDMCLTVSDRKVSEITNIINLLENKKKELDNYYQDHFKILTQSKKNIRTQHLAKLELEKKEWLKDHIDQTIDEILRTQYRHGPKIEKEKQTINNCWKGELVDFHQNFWNMLGSKKFSSFEEYLSYLEKRWDKH